ncbi:MAG TPA: hypothetical protein VF121_00580 [Thermoanaerobaculia bacterium]|nr:hypothetical protein [Thermoanaerobaculia bacterium]
MSSRISKAGPQHAWPVYVCAALIAISTGVVLWRLAAGPESRTHTRQQPDQRTMRAVLTRSWATDSGEMVRPESFDSKYLVLYLFTPQDCAACLFELAGLSRFSPEHPDFRVVPVMGFSNADEARQTRANLGLDIPILQDPQGELVRALAPPKMPWKIVVETATGKVLLEDLPAADTFAAQKFLGRLEALERR